jgi:two-component system response regulator PilR (NtrC family)
VIVIGIPPLRERLEDLPELCDALLTRICKESGFSVPHLPEMVLEQLRAHTFNGNVRELENILHRAVALGEGGELLLDNPQTAMQPLLPLTAAAVTAPVMLALPDNLQDYLDAQERDILCRVLQDTRYNRTAAASKLGMSLRQIRYRIARLNIAMPDGDSPDASHDSTHEPA